MTERRRSRNAPSPDVRDKERETAQRKSEEEALDLLDDPQRPDEASPVRHWIYFSLVLVGSFLINVVALLLVSGGK